MNKSGQWSWFMGARSRPKFQTEALPFRAYRLRRPTRYMLTIPEPIGGRNGRETRCGGRRHAPRGEAAGGEPGPGLEGASSGKTARVQEPGQDGAAEARAGQRRISRKKRLREQHPLLPPGRD